MKGATVGATDNINFMTKKSRPNIHSNDWAISSTKLL
jgi:hypothetical protein